MDKKILLIVDDEKAYARSLAFALKRDFETITASSLDEALNRLKEGNIRAALLDVRLDENDVSNKDGLRILEWINQNCPVVQAFVMTSYKDEGYREEALQLGAQYFFEKPIDILRMRAILKEKMD
ncbi:MAG: response regulator [Candidatus Aminicenantes bacterium]|nr:response regulator [Candidatus Aminicenantes bacterium]